MTVGAVIVAAGLSSRMKDFKPLMKIGDRTMIEMTINNYQALKVDEIVVVTGYRANDIKDVLSGKNISFIHNEDYEKTHMFDSICLGLKEMERSVDLVFITPSDSPFVQQFTLKKMLDLLIKKGYNLLQPSYYGKNGHPLLVRSDYISMLIKHDGTNGMQGLIAKMGKDFINVPFVDPGIILDADTKKDYERLLDYNEERRCPSLDLCRKIQDYFEVSDSVKVHSDKVAEVALNIYQILTNKGIKLDKKLILAASLLHDIAKGKAHHGEVGADWLLDMGFIEVSEIVREHMELKNFPSTITEKEVVYLADKLVIEDKLSAIEDRFSYKEELYKNNEGALSSVKRRKKEALFLHEIVFGRENY
ncbi:MAG: NTP transferase domain-containing protein [Tissierellia bacterium]|nr:NTP transferase domain-containing protein [Tissierellia bacterium]